MPLNIPSLNLSPLTENEDILEMSVEELELPLLSTPARDAGDGEELESIFENESRGEEFGNSCIGWIGLCSNHKALESYTERCFEGERVRGILLSKFHPVDFPIRARDGGREECSHYGREGEDVSEGGLEFSGNSDPFVDESLGRVGAEDGEDNEVGEGD